MGSNQSAITVLLYKMKRRPPYYTDRYFNLIILTEAV